MGRFLFLIGDEVNEPQFGGRTRREKATATPQAVNPIPATNEIHYNSMSYKGLFFERPCC